jgi:RNA polymerase sigma-70 factor (ECF subfamily)
MTRGASGGDRSEWVGSLYDRLGASLYRYAVMILADRDAAADAVQQAFVAVLGLRGVDMESEERYLRRAVRNQCYDMLRRKRSFANAIDAELLEPALGHDDHPEERLTLERAIRELPPNQREVLHLKIYEQWTFQEIADQMDLSINTVASRYRYAIEKLRAAFVVGVKP